MMMKQVYDGALGVGAQVGVGGWQQKELGPNLKRRGGRRYLSIRRQDRYDMVSAFLTPPSL